MGGFALPLSAGLASLAPQPAPATPVGPAPVSLVDTSALVTPVALQTVAPPAAPRKPHRVARRPVAPPTREARVRAVMTPTFYVTAGPGSVIEWRAVFITVEWTVPPPRVSHSQS
jgi:hypothetical protein